MGVWFLSSFFGNYMAGARDTPQRAAPCDFLWRMIAAAAELTPPFSCSAALAAGGWPVQGGLGRSTRRCPTGCSGAYAARSPCSMVRAAAVAGALPRVIHSTTPKEVSVVCLLQHSTANGATNRSQARSWRRWRSPCGWRSRHTRPTARRQTERPTVRRRRPSSASHHHWRVEPPQRREHGLPEGDRREGGDGVPQDSEEDRGDLRESSDGERVGWPVEQAGGRGEQPAAASLQQAASVVAAP